MAKHNLKCWIWKILWSFGGLSLVLSWIAFNQGQIASLPTEVWLWNALVFGVLAISIKLDCYDCHACHVGGNKPPQ